MCVRPIILRQKTRSRSKRVHNAHTLLIRVSVCVCVRPRVRVRVPSAFAAHTHDIMWLLRASPAAVSCETLLHIRNIIYYTCEHQSCPFFGRPTAQHQQQHAKINSRGLCADTRTRHALRLRVRRIRTRTQTVVLFSLKCCKFQFDSLRNVFAAAAAAAAAAARRRRLSKLYSVNVCADATLASDMECYVSTVRGARPSPSMRWLR